MVFFVVSAVFAGCSSQKPAGEQKPVKAKELKLGYINAPVGPMHEAALKFAEIVKQKTNGQYTVKVYPNSQLGNERELADAVSLGTVDMTLSGPTPITWYIPQYSVVESPFLYRDLDHYMKMYKSDVGQELKDQLLKTKGLRVLDFWFRGPRYLTANKEIKNLDDLKGLKIRVPESEIPLETWRILGANPTPIAFNELYMGLKQGVVVAQENPLEMIFASSLYDVQKFVMNTKHAHSAYFLMINDKLFTSMPADVQKTLQEAAVEAGLYEKELMLKSESEFKKKLEEKGVKFVDLDMKPFNDLVSTELPKKLQSKNKRMDIYEKVKAMK
jgi:tripartite ATP-independent transporter DctP family solute receptor